MLLAFDKFLNKCFHKCLFEPWNNLENEGAEKVLFSSFPSKETKIEIVASCHSGPMAGVPTRQIKNQLRWQLMKSSLVHISQGRLLRREELLVWTLEISLK